MPQWAMRDHFTRNALASPFIALSILAPMNPLNRALILQVTYKPTSTILREIAAPVQGPSDW